MQIFAFGGLKIVKKQIMGAGFEPATSCSQSTSNKIIYKIIFLIGNSIEAMNLFQELLYNGRKIMNWINNGIIYSYKAVITGTSNYGL